MTDQQAEDPVAVRRALTRYRVMAIVTGSFLLIVTVDVILKYVVGWDHPTFLSFSQIAAIAHGWIYAVYLVVSVHLWTRRSWTLKRLAYMVLGGVVPLLSFFAERRITREVTGSLDS